MKNKTPNKRERARERHEEQERLRAARKIRRRLRTIVYLSVFLGFAIGAGYWLNSAVKTAEAERLGERHAIEGREHITSGGHHAPYQTNPPTSGAHGEALPWGVYDEEVPDERAVHNLEHGGIWVSYTNISDDELAILKRFAQRHPGSVLLSPRSANDAPIAVASWGRLMKLDTVSEEILERYLSQNINRSPERLAR